MRRGARLRSGAVARLATTRADRRPHIVPICFVLEGDTLVSVVDGKPKRSADLLRLANVRAHDDVSLLVDHYDDDWTRLWWVRLDGVAEVVAEGSRARGRDRATHGEVSPVRNDDADRRGPAVTVTGVASWEATPGI